MTEKYITAGQILREARTGGRRKREISTISKLLCISEDYLNALERSDYKSIPETVYVLGFARNYAMELGLDPEEIIGKIKKEMGIIEENEEEVEEKIEAVKEKKALFSSMNNNEFMGKTSKYVYKNWKWLAISAVAITIALVSFSLLLRLGGKSSESDSYENINIVVKDPNYNQAVREKFGLENREASKVFLQATQESWVKIEDERGNTVFSRVLVAGDVYYVPSGDNFKATFGNAGGIDVWVNGDLIPKLGRVNERKGGISMKPESLAQIKAE